MSWAGGTYAIKPAKTAHDLKMLDQAFEGSHQGVHEDHKVLKTKTHIMVED
jgi:hypothetical protein